MPPPPGWALPRCVAELGSLCLGKGRLHGKCQCAAPSIMRSDQLSSGAPPGRTRSVSVHGTHHRWIELCFPTTGEWLFRMGVWDLNSVCELRCSSRRTSLPRPQSWLLGMAHWHFSPVMAAGVCWNGLQITLIGTPDA
jgi:hypothetical protein